MGMLVLDASTLACIFSIYYVKQGRLHSTEYTCNMYLTPHPQ